MASAEIFSIEEFSVYDGPGMRTTVFIAGCPLRCEWCHNPEGQSTDKLILRSPNGCIGCGSCMKDAVRVGDRVLYSPDAVGRCPKRLLRPRAVTMTENELMARLMPLLPILNAAGGGVTFSGGEPTFSGEFLIESLRLLEGRTHRAVESCGYCPRELFLSVLDECELVLFDLKIIDSDSHKRYTGRPNGIILENFRTLVKSGRDFTVRVPLIPTVTDTERNLTDIARLLCECGVKRVELLPYNKLAGAKYPLAGMVYAPSFDEKKAPEPRAEIFASYGLLAEIR